MAAIPVDEVKAESSRALAAGDATRALHLQCCIVESAPHDYEARLRIADVLARIGATDAARHAYRGVALFCARAGRPLPAIVAGRVLGALGGAADEVLDAVATLYSADSPTVAQRGARVSIPMGVRVDQRLLAAVPATLELLSRAAWLAGAEAGVAFPDRLHAIPLLSSLPREGLARALSAMRVHRLPDRASVIREGEPGTSLFLCAGGKLVVFKGEDAKELGRLGEGALFGEMAVLSGGARTASIRTDGDADLLELGRDPLSEIAAALPTVGEALDRYRRERLLQNVLALSPLFRPFSPDQRVQLLHRFEGLEALDGDVLIRQGEEGRGLFIILDGECEVTRADGDIDVTVATLHTGDLFGEIALIHDVPATATVTAAGPATLLVLDGGHFRKLVESVPDLRAYFEGLAGDRLRKTGNLLGDEVLLQVADGLLTG